jgi:HNH endonuclease
MNDLTRERVQSVLDYDFETGRFTWREDRANRKMRAGAEAGHVDRAGYRYIRVGRELHLAHRLAWLLVNGERPPGRLRHLNGDRSDNRVENIALERMPRLRTG